MLIERRGNLLEQDDIDIIAHCCNTQGKMGAGIAKEIANRYTETYLAFSKYHREGKDKLGTVLLHGCRNKLFAHCYAQETMYPRGICHVDYTALERCLIGAYRYAKENKLVVGVPYKMASDLAGGDWNIILGILEKIFTDVDCIICRLK